VLLKVHFPKFAEAIYSYEEGQFMGFLDFAKQKPKLLLLGAVIAGTLAVGFTYTNVFLFPSYGGTLSPYLIGYFDVRDQDQIGFARANIIVNNGTDVGIDLANPTTTSLRAFIALFSSSGVFLSCHMRTVDTNENVRVFLRNDLNFNIFNRTGVIKVVTTLDNDLSKVQAGVKGLLTHYVAQQPDGNGRDNQIVVSRQTNFEEVPLAVLNRNGNAELISIIVNGCPNL